MTQPSTTDRPPEPQPLDVRRDGLRIPTSLWSPRGAARGIVLACHGGGGHKQCSAMVDIARECTKADLAVLAIDGPVHGERRADGNLDPDLAKESFRRAWLAGVGRTDVGKDFSAALDALLTHAEFEGLPVAYVGVSMGTAYGIPLLASDTRIRAAAIGQWGLDYPASEHLADFAERIRCKVWFNEQLADAVFDHAGTMRLFESIASADKRLVAYPGPHQALRGQRLSDAIGFLADALSSAHVSQ